MRQETQGPTKLRKVPILLPDRRPERIPGEHLAIQCIKDKNKASDIFANGIAGKELVYYIIMPTDRSPLERSVRF